MDTDVVAAIMGGYDGGGLETFLGGLDVSSESSSDVSSESGDDVKTNASSEHAKPKHVKPIPDDPDKISSSSESSDGETSSSSSSEPGDNDAKSNSDVSDKPYISEEVADDVSGLLNRADADISNASAEIKAAEAKLEASIVQGPYGELEHDPATIDDGNTKGTAKHDHHKKPDAKKEEPEDEDDEDGVAGGGDKPSLDIGNPPEMVTGGTSKNENNTVPVMTPTVVEPPAEPETPPVDPLHADGILAEPASPLEDAKPLQPPVEPLVAGGGIPADSGITAVADAFGTFTATPPPSRPPSPVLLDMEHADHPAHAFTPTHTDHPDGSHEEPITNEPPESFEHVIKDEEVVEQKLHEALAATVHIKNEAQTIMERKEAEPRADNLEMQPAVLPLEPVVKQEEPPKADLPRVAEPKHHKRSKSSGAKQHAKKFGHKLTKFTKRI